MIEWDIEELACIVCGKTEEETDEIINNQEVDVILDEKYGIDFETYCEVVKDLLPFTPIITTALLGEANHAFVHGDRCIVKQKASPYELA